ncbi:hypothetical protein Trydic_g17158 [Trypoxylus dichotomus]
MQIYDPVYILGSRPYKCDNCDRSYTMRCNLRRHIRIECGKERQIACDYCNARFYYTSELKKHLRTHERRTTGYTQNVISLQMD